MRFGLRRILFALAMVTLPAFGGAPNGGWTEVFQAPPAHFAVDPGYLKTYGIGAPMTVSGTLRYTLVVSAGGSALRIRFSNETGTAPLIIKAASLARAGADLDSADGPLLPLTFGGSRSITIPAGAPALSDPVKLKMTAGEHLVVSLYTAAISFEPIGGAHMLLAEGDQTANAQLVHAKAITGRPFVSGAAVQSLRPLPVIVAMGDSLTDGVRGNPAQLRGYADQLARRFAKRPPSRRHAVINAGIGGNRVLETGWGDNALARLERDVLRIDGVSHLILFEGINDIGMSGQTIFGEAPPVTADDLIAAYRQIIARAHARGIKVILGTLTPFQGAGYYTPEKDAVRLAVNAWIRSAKESDGVIDFEAVLRDKTDPRRVSAAYDCGDHLHPNDAGYHAMGDAIEMALFR